MSIFKRETLIQILKFVVAFGLIGALIYHGALDLSLLKELLAPQYTLALLGLAGLSIVVSNCRWLLLLKERGINTDFRGTFPVYLIGIFFNYALPGSVGGDVVKAYYVAQDYRPKRADAVATVLFDRILGLYSMLIISLAVILNNLNFVLSEPQLVGVSVGVVVVFTLMTLFFGVALSRTLRELVGFDEFLVKMPLGDKLQKAYLLIHAYRDHTGVIFKSILLSILSQSVTIVFMWVVGQAIGQGQISWATYFFAVPIGFIVSALPLAPAGIGVGQMAFLFLFQVFSGEKTPLGQTAITAFQIALLIWGFLGAYFYLRRKKPVLDEVNA